MKQRNKDKIFLEKFSLKSWNNSVLIPTPQTSQLALSKAAEDGEYYELSHIASGCAKWCSHFGSLEMSSELNPLTLQLSQDSARHLPK